MIVGYIAKFADGDAVANDEGSIMVFGSRNDFSHFLRTAEGEELINIILHEITYDQILRDLNNVNFALDEKAFNMYRKFENKNGITVSKQNFAEVDQGLIKFATLRKRKILH